MQTADFLQKLVPAQGFKCIAVRKEPKGWKHYFNHTHAEAAEAALLLDNEGKNVYFALASYQTTDNRKGENAKLVQAFWVDLDVGDGKPYTTQIEAGRALVKFCRETGLPNPMVVSSGNGLHVYWPLSSPIAAVQWRVVAFQLKQLTELAGLQADPTRTADIASVLRPIDTHNPKGGGRVRLLCDADAVDPETFEALLHDGLARFGELPGVPPQKRKATNADLTGEQDYPPSSAYLIADKCMQVAHIRDTLGNVEEPLWYAAVGLLRFTIEGDALVQEWSSGHPDYDEDATARKIQQHADSGSGPTTCAYFQKIRPAGCVGCPHKITSPISLGHPEPEPLDEPPVSSDGEVLPPVPYGYQRTNKGLCVLVKDDNGEQKWVPFCSYDLYPVDRLRSEGCEVLRLRAKFPVEGWQEFDLGVGTIMSSTKDLMRDLGQAGVVLKPIGVKHMPGYLISWIQDLQKSKGATEVVTQLGWQEDGSFVIGTRRYLPNGKVVPAVLSEDLMKGELDKKFPAPKGTLEGWRRAAGAYNPVSMEQYQFVVGAAFGAPLMRFMPQQAALIHILSTGSGQGKTTAEGAAMSVYGLPFESRLRGGDTMYSFFHQLGGYRSLPGVVDELDHKRWDMSDFVHSITSGKERSRLRSDGSPRNPGTFWQTLVVASSNQSIAEKLAATKSNPEAEVARIIEYHMKMPALYTKQEADELFPLFTDNYGIAGDIYIRWLTQNQQSAAKCARRWQEYFDKLTGMAPVERYWSVAVGCILAGLFIARDRGLVDYDVKMLARWAAERIDDMRALVHETVRGPLDAFGAFLNEHINQILVVDRPVDGRRYEGCHVLNRSSVRGPLVARKEESNQRLFVSKSFFNKWAAESGTNIAEVRRELQEKGALIRNNVLKCLGRGTEYATGFREKCWEIDCSASALNGLVDLSLVNNDGYVGEQKQQIVNKDQ